MADTPETPPAKRVKKASPAKAPKAKPAMMRTEMPRLSRPIPM